MIDWISVKERVPDNRRTVLAWGYFYFKPQYRPREEKFMGVTKFNPDPKSRGNFDCEKSSWRDLWVPRGYPLGRDRGTDAEDDTVKFRAKYVVGLGYFAQVKTGFFAGWKTIGRHPENTFGLYPNDHLDYPLESYIEAEQRCWEYEQWAKDVLNPTVTYYLVPKRGE